MCVYREESIDIPSERKPIEPWCGVIVAVSSSASEDFYQKRLSRPRPPHCFVEPGRKSACVCVCVERPFEGCLTIISGTFLVFLGASLHAYWFLCPKKNPFVCSVATFPECSLTQTSLTFGGVRDLVCVCVCVCCPWKDSIHIFCRYLSSPKKGSSASSTPFSGWCSLSFQNSILAGGGGDGGGDGEGGR